MIKAPSVIPEYLAEAQWIYWGCMAAISVFLLWHGRQRADKFSFRFGGALLVITALWVALATVFVTPNERLYQAHKALAQAAANHDASAMINFFEPGTRIPILGKVDISSAGEQIAERLKTFGVKGSMIQNLQIQRTGTSAITQLRILTESDFGFVKTSWRLEWIDIPSQNWRIVGIDLLSVGDQSSANDNRSIIHVK